MALTGSQKAYRYALSNVARSGATRSGYVGGLVFVSVGGLPQHVQIDSLEIVDELNETPNTCRFRIIGPTTVTTGLEVIITLGSMNGQRLFAGHVLDVQQSYWAKPVNVRTDVQAVDYTWQFGFPKVTKKYAGLSATAIVQDLIATYAAANGFTGANVAAGLPTIPEITFTNEDLGEALSRTANRIGAYWYVDYFRDVHFFFTDTAQVPSALVPTHPSLANVTRESDRSQALTRVYVEGRGSTLLSAVNIGDTILPLEAVDMFAVSSDVFVKASFQGSEGGAQHLSFTGVQVGGGGTLIGPGISPAGAPALTMQAGTGLGSGTYAYAYSDVTAVGESLPSPVASLTVGSVAPPPAPTNVAVFASVFGPDVGTHRYALTFVTASGETTPSALSPVATTSLSSCSPPNITVLEAYGGGSMNDENYFTYAATGIGNNGGETTYGGVRVIFLGTGYTQVRVYFGGGVGLSAVKLYRSAAGGNPPYKYVGTFAGAFFDDKLSDAQLGAPTPATNTATYFARRVEVYPLAIGGPSVTGRKLYRTAAGGSVLREVATLNNTVTLFSDTYADSDIALSPSPPTVNTAGGGVNQIALAGIAIGPPGTTARRIYRTVVNGTQLKLWTTLPENVTTTTVDGTPDGSLGANAPTSDTSGFTQPDGQILAGATTILVAGTGGFLPTGGWAILGNGEQFVRYTGITGNSLTGVPSSGNGALRATVSYNSTITAAPMLTGIPASGVRSILQALSAGDEIYLVVQVDDATRQAQLAAAVGGTGIREEWVQDRRLSIGEARARGNATLAERTLDQIRVSYTSRDLLTRSGKDIVANLPAPTNLVGTFKIQHVVIHNFRPFPNQYPTFTVQASSSRFSFEDLLRLATRDVAR